MPIEGIDLEVTSVSEYSQVSYCKIPSDIEYVDTSGSGGLVIIKESYEEFTRHTRRLLDLLMESQQLSSKHSTWGKTQSPKVFRHEAGERIKEGGSIIDRFCGSSKSSMLTLTVPGSTWYCFDAVARWSGWLVNRMLQVIRRVPSSEPPIYWFFVWEHQKRGALHLHFCLGWDVPASKREALAVSLKDKWFECLLELLDKDGVDCFQRKGFSQTWRDTPEKWQWDYQEIKKSVAGYFAKYCQKNSEQNGSEGTKNCNHAKITKRSRRKAPSKRGVCYPSRYWGSSQTIKVWIKRLSVHISMDVYSQDELENICNRIRCSVLAESVITSVSVGSFEILDEKNDVCIASGQVETYCLDADSYPHFWSRVYSDVFERSLGELAWMQEFMDTSSSASMQESLELMHAKKRLKPRHPT